MTRSQPPSAGLLVYRRGADGTIEVFLAHPGGPFWARKDAGAWSIPKGEIEPDEDPLAAAIREFTEETSLPAPDGPYVPLGQILRRDRRPVLAWAVAGDLAPEAASSNTFEMEWPPRSGRMRSVPEIDRFAWFTIDEARRRINDRQAPFLDRLLEQPG